VSTFLWILVSMGVVNTVAVLFQAARGWPDPVKPSHRVIDAAYTLGVGMFALWFLARGV
jgi:hypothetical protein